MKKKFLPLMFAAAAFLFTACAPSPSEVARKIVENEELSQQDYMVAVEYTLDAMENISDTITKYEKDRQGLATAFKAMIPEYREGDVILAKLQQTDPASLDEETRQLYEKAIKLQEDNALRFAVAMGYGGTILDPSHREADEDVADSTRVLNDSTEVR